MKEDTSPVVQEQCGFLLIKQMVTENSMHYGRHFKMYVIGASLVAQWLRICLLMQGMRVQALVWEDPTCHGATGPVSHNY